MSCALGDFGPAPAGLDYCENKNATIIGPVVTFMVFGVAAVIVRMGCRYSVRQNTAGMSLSFLAIDDYFLIGALLMAISTAICCFLGVYYGGGQHLWVMTFEKFNHLWKTLFAFVLIYVAGVSLTKTSILLFYYRLFNANSTWWVALFLVVGYFISIIVTACVSCRPLSFFWGQYTDPNATGTCINIPSFFFINGVCAMLIDVLILVTPLPTIYKLNMPPGKKALVAAILLLGSFVCVASIVRIVALHQFTEATDVVWSMADVFVWSCCEPFVGIICACLPTYGPLFSRFRWFKGSSGRSNQPPSGGNLSGGKDLITIGGSRMTMPMANNKTNKNKSKGWSMLSKGDNLMSVKSSQQTSSAFRTRPDEDEIELTATIQGGKMHVDHMNQQEHHQEGYSGNVDGSARSTTQNSDSDGADDKNMQVRVQRDMSWQVEYRK